MKRKFFIYTVFLFIVFSISSVAISETGKKKKDDLYRQAGLFSDVLARIESEYVDETNTKDLIYGALKGMLASLDPYSQFMDPDTYNELKVDTEGKFGGVGIEITVKDGLLTVITPIEDTPAWKAGIKANDRIVKINNEITRDLTLTDAVKKLRGKPGESVRVTVLRESEKKLLEFKLVRDIIKIKDIKEARILQEHIGYIRLVEFRERTAQEMDAAVDNLNKQGMDALVLDLRNNPGGLLSAAVEVAEKFINPNKIIVYTRGRNKKSQNLEYLSRGSHPILDTPMVVLINEGSASGSEIVAACFQDYRRAIIMGKKSFGKGSVQTVFPLSDGSAIRLTTSKYFTPLGKEIHGKGVIPDIIVEDGKIQVSKDKEESEQKAADIFDELEKKEKIKKETTFDYTSDSQLMRAIDVLKAMRIFKETKK